MRRLINTKPVKGWYCNDQNYLIRRPLFNNFVIPKISE